MKHKHIVALLLFFFVTSLSAAYLEPLDDPTKYYVGPIIGTAIPTVKYRVHNSITHETHFSQANQNSLLAGGVFGLQTIYCNDLILGLQINVMYNSFKNVIRSSTNDMGILAHSVESKNLLQYGLDGRLGFNFENIMPYILIGAESGKWNMFLNNDSSIKVRGIPQSSKIEFTRTLVGPKIGIGLGFPIFCDVNLNLEYNFTWFHSLGGNLSVTPNEFWSHRVKMYQNAALLGINWFF